MDVDPHSLVFGALSSATRRRILDVLKAQPGCSVNDVASHFEMSRIAVMKHLKVLEGAGLVLSRKEGRRRVLHFNPVPIQEIYDRWTTEFSKHWAARMTRVKYVVEAQGDSDER
ncbi:ArsR/SmtB family transcription factor [Engelhardtia mirabilis]|uniref:HTH-type transcriptional regulator n=1 Tax=Engelhardtia mirabilis TaxID=2528011 RepID=A0A518BMC1_9BACT|nr:HTH-type transcriptional regulator [Planctomycetes bacterium Pla133]QDV02455.1 HTH-type transcriptional regulator [Planctomycetes bacterium Pla86]